MAVSASSVGAANAVGGTINRVIQDEETSIGQIATDAAVGAVSTVAGKLIGGVVSKKINQLSPAVKGKIGEKVTELKYKAMGYSNEGKALVSTGRKTATGREEVAKYDFLFRNYCMSDKNYTETGYNSHRKLARFY